MIKLYSTLPNPKTLCSTDSFLISGWLKDCKISIKRSDTKDKSVLEMELLVFDPLSLRMTELDKLGRICGAYLGDHQNVEPFSKIMLDPLD